MTLAQAPVICCMRSKGKWIAWIDGTDWATCGIAGRSQRAAVRKLIAQF